MISLFSLLLAHPCPIKSALHPPPQSSCTPDLSSSSSSYAASILVRSREIWEETKQEALEREGERREAALTPRPRGEEEEQEGGSR